MEQLVIKIAGIGQVTSIALVKHGFKTVADVANATAESLSIVPGFSNARAIQTIKKAKALLQTEKVSVSKEVSDSSISKSKGKLVSKKEIKNKKPAKKSKNKAKKDAKNKKTKKMIVKLIAKELANKTSKLKHKKTAKDKEAKKKKVSKKK